MMMVLPIAEKARQDAIEKAEKENEQIPNEIQKLNDRRERGLYGDEAERNAIDMKIRGLKDERRNNEFRIAFFRGSVAANLPRREGNSFLF